MNSADIIHLLLLHKQAHDKEALHNHSMGVYTNNRSRLSVYVPSGAYLYTTGYVHNRRNGSSYLPHTMHRTCRFPQFLTYVTFDHRDSLLYIY